MIPPGSVLLQHPTRTAWFGGLRVLRTRVGRSGGRAAKRCPGNYRWGRSAFARWRAIPLCTLTPCSKPYKNASLTTLICKPGRRIVMNWENTIAIWIAWVVSTEKLVTGTGCQLFCPGGGGTPNRTGGGGGGIRLGGGTCRTLAGPLGGWDLIGGFRTIPCVSLNTPCSLEEICTHSVSHVFFHR